MHIINYLQKTVGLADLTVVSIKLYKNAPNRMLLIEKCTIFSSWPHFKNIDYNYKYIAGVTWTIK